MVFPEVTSRRAGNHRESRHGFTILEVVVAVAMMAILTAIVIPSITRYLDQERINDTVSTLTDLTNALNTFRTKIGDSPFRLTHLGRAISTSDTTDCSGIASATPTTLYAASSTWASGGPYYPKAMSVQGLPLPIGKASDTVIRTSNSTTVGFLQIKITSVAFADARKLNDQIDGTTDADQGNRSNTTGTVQWGIPNSEERVTILYHISVGAGC